MASPDWGHSMARKGNREPKRSREHVDGALNRVVRAQKVRRAAPVAGVILIALVAAVITAAPSKFETDVSLLSSADPAKRQEASDRLGKGDASQATKILGELDANHSPMIRAGLVRSLSKLPVDGSHANRIAELLKHEDPSARASAAEVLQKVSAARDKVLEKLLAVCTNTNELAGVRISAIRALRGASGKAATTLESLAASESSTLRKAAISSLGFIPTTGPSKLAAIATDKERGRKDRELAICALGRVTGSNSSSASGQLKTLVKNSSGFVREHATVALSARAESGSTQTLVALTKDTDARVRLEALHALIDAEAVSAQKGTVKSLLSDTDVRVQALACRCAETKKPWPLVEVRSAFVSLLSSPTFLVRLRAALALAAYGDKGGLAQMNIDKSSKNKIIAAEAKAAYDIINQIGK